MTLTRLHLEVLGAVLALAGLLFLAYEWHVSTLAKVQMEATVAAQKQIIDQAAADRAQHQKDDAALAAQTAATLQTMQQALKQVQTPVQIGQWSQAQLEQAIKGIQVVVPQPTAANPHPEASVTIPESSLSSLRDTIEQCKECDVKLQSAQALAESRLQQMADADAQIKALQTQRDAAVKAAKGTTLQRFVQAAKWVLVGGALGYAAAKH